MHIRHLYIQYILNHYTPSHNSTEELLHPEVIKVSLPSVSIKIVTRPLSTMGQYACTLESMVSYHYPPRNEDKTRQTAAYE